MKLPTTPVVYLAGGMRSDWRDRVKDELPRFLFIDPSRHGLTCETEYTAWDLTGVARCDIVFGYMAKDNPSGYGLALEMGVAVALGKKIIYVEEEGLPQTKYLGMVRSVADVVTPTLAAGIDRLGLIEGARS